MIKNTSHHSVQEIESLMDLLDRGIALRNCAIQGVDLTAVDINWRSLDVKGAAFLGCRLRPSDTEYLLSAGAMLFPTCDDLPYQPYRSQLYGWEELLEGSDSGKSKDLIIYEHFSSFRFSPSITEALYQRIHDHAIDDALGDYLQPRADKTYNRKCVGIMGGHGTLRTDPNYAKVVRTAHLLSKAGYLVVSGGGPGIMEAANLGAYLGKYDDDVIDDVIATMSKAPHYTDPGYSDAAINVLRTYDDGCESLAIPTWFYGHEPSNVFATQIAKYFSNSIREDNLLAICLHGIVFAPGSAGTTQEIFQDAAQNHYTTFDYVSPMVFLGEDRYTKETNLYDTLHQLAAGKEYQQYIILTDTPAEAAAAIAAHPPIPVQ